MISFIILIISLLISIADENNKINNKVIITSLICFIFTFGLIIYSWNAPTHYIELNDISISSFRQSLDTEHDFIKGVDHESIQTNDYYTIENDVQVYSIPDRLCQISSNTSYNHIVIYGEKFNNKWLNLVLNDIENYKDKSYEIYFNDNSN
ncbi:hypothetical protein [Clostridium sp.]|uniref:hypothetical protein n=1 Tax=Clostridium sp. TaxID=1506 RepID=UPI00262B2118|nr:hypothetical protein [Clostridium sp.]